MVMAERVGFEPTERFPVHSISSAASSTTPAPLRCCSKAVGKHSLSCESRHVRLPRGEFLALPKRVVFTFITRVSCEPSRHLLPGGINMSNSTRQYALRCFSLVFMTSLLVVACKRSSYDSSPPSSPPASSSNSSDNSGGGSVPVSNARKLPAGFRSIPPASRNGDLLYCGMRGTAAKAGPFAAPNALAGNFDAAPHVLGAMSTENNDEAQALIDGVRDGQPIRGMGYAQTDGSQCVVAVVYDRADNFATSSADLVHLAQQTLPAASAATPVPLQHTTLAHGTTLDVPSGWNVQPNNGAGGGTGPQGTFDFGQAMEVYTPEAAAYYAQPYGARAPLVSAYGDPGRELQ